MDLGGLCTPNPQLLARIILGMQIHHVFGRLAAHRDSATNEIEVLARGAINILWARIALKSTVEIGE
jgi:hypothetical protein